MRIKGYTVFLMCVAVAVIAVGCKGKFIPSADSAVVVNQYQLTAAEFNELFADAMSEDTPEMRSAFLERLIMRKILLQEAQREKLDTRKSFLRAIENFWEQSLLKIVIDNKTQEFAKGLKVTDEEVAEAYSQLLQENPEMDASLEAMKGDVYNMLLQEKQSQAFEKWLGVLKEDAHISIKKEEIGII